MHDCLGIHVRIFIHNSVCTKSVMCCNADIPWCLPVPSAALQVRSYATNNIFMSVCRKYVCGVVCVCVSECVCVCVLCVRVSLWFVESLILEELALDGVPYPFLDDKVMLLCMSVFHSAQLWNTTQITVNMMCVFVCLE